MRGNFVTLVRDSPFYAIFENGNAPVKNWILPNEARLDGSAETEVYMLDVNRCTDEQLNAIADLIAAKFGASKAEVLDQIKSRGMPIRASQVQSAWSNIPAFL
jgi:hypothetical protein